MREPKVYPEGWFSAPVRAWRSMQFKPQLIDGVSDQKAAALALALDKANQARKAGKGWANGTCPMPGTPDYLAPKDMERRSS